MKVLFLIHRYPPALGGSERFVQEIALRLVAEGHRATVYTSDVLDIEGFWRRGFEHLPSGLESDAGVQVHRFQARVLPLHGVVSRLLGLVPWAPIGLTMAPPGLVLPGMWQAVRSGGDFDLVHASAYPSLMYLGAVAARRSNARLVLMPCAHPGVDTRGAGQRYFLSPRMIDLYRQADAVITLTEQERRIMIQAGVPSKQVVVSGAGVEPKAAASAAGDRFRRQFGLQLDAPLVVFVGHKTVGKGVLHLLEACQILLPERPDLVVALVGAPTPEFTCHYQALPDPIRGRILDLRLSERDKHDLLAAASILVLPSRDDSFGIVLLEAWLHGKPVVGARAGGILEVIDEGRSGLLVPFGDAMALAEAIAWLLDHPSKAAQMGARGRETTLQRWTWQAVYNRVRVVYEGCLDR